MTVCEAVARLTGQSSPKLPFDAVLAVEIDGKLRYVEAVPIRFLRKRGERDSTAVLTLMPEGAEGSNAK